MDGSNLFFYTSGTAPGSITSSQLVVTTATVSQGTVVYYNVSQHALYGFETFVIQPPDVAAHPGGGDGYALYGSASATDCVLVRSSVYPQTADSFVCDGSSVNWILTDDVVSINTSLSSLCPANISVVISFTVTSKNDTLAQLDNILTALAQLLQISRSRVIFVAITFTDCTKRAVLDNDLQAELLEISQPTLETQSEPSAAAAVKSLVETATNQRAMNHVVNGGTDGTNEFTLVDVKSDVQAVPSTRISPPTSVPTDTPRSVPVALTVSRVLSCVCTVH